MVASSAVVWRDGKCTISLVLLFFDEAELQQKYQPKPKWNLNIRQRYSQVTPLKKFLHTLLASLIFYLLFSVFLRFNFFPFHSLSCFLSLSYSLNDVVVVIVVVSVPIFFLAIIIKVYLTCFFFSWLTFSWDFFFLNSTFYSICFSIMFTSSTLTS